MKAEPPPAPIDSFLEKLPNVIQECFPNNLVNITLFGSGAEDALRPSSDLNLLIVLDTFDAAQAQKFRIALEKLNRSRKLSVMLLLKHEIHDAARLFAVKFGDMVRRHKTLYGEDIARMLEISREAKKTLLHQTLMNYILRTRSTYATAETRHQLRTTLNQSAGALRAAAATLLELEGQPADSPRAALQSIAEHYGPPFGQATKAMTRTRNGELLEESETESALEQLIKLAGMIFQRAKKLT